MADDLLATIDNHLASLAPHARERKTAQLLAQAASRLRSKGDDIVDPDLRCQDNDAGTLLRSADEIKRRLPGPVGESFAETLESIAGRAVQCSQSTVEAAGRIETLTRQIERMEKEGTE